MFKEIIKKIFSPMTKTVKREIIINAERLETRVAVMENGRLEEFQIEHPTEQRSVGSIFKGRVQNLEHDLQAAFISIGMSKNAFLHYWDMNPDEDAILNETEDDDPRKRKPRKLRNRPRKPPKPHKLRKPLPKRKTLQNWESVMKK